ncbi:MAG: LysR family transcriptional regulator [Polyangiaceae bacterium]
MRAVDVCQSGMAPIDASALDLNLLTALDVLLAERNVTRAARKLGLTQSSASHALARLRDMLGDPLLVREGRGMVPTPRAEALAAPLRRALTELRRVVATEGGFDPATSSRTFTLGCPDLVMSLLPELVAALAAGAPHVRLDTVLSTGLESLAALGAGAVDAVLGPAPEQPPSGLASRVLGGVAHVVLARKGHPALARGKRWTLDAWLSYPHVVVRTGSAGPGAIGLAIARAGKERTIGMTAPSFLVAPFVVAETDFFYAGPRELLTSLARSLGLVTLDVPLSLPQIPVALLWHERMTADPGHTWFRERLAAVARSRLTRRRQG